MRCWSNTNKCCKTAIKIGISIIRRQAAYVYLSLRRLSLLRKLHQFTRSRIDGSGVVGRLDGKSINRSNPFEKAGLYPSRHEISREYIIRTKVLRWDAHERSLAYKTTDIFATAIRGMFCRSSGRDHIANLSMFKDISSASRSMIRKCRKLRLPWKCQSPIIPILSHVLNHTRGPTSCEDRDTRREDCLQSMINRQIELTSFTIVLQFVSLDSLANYWLIIICMIGSEMKTENFCYHFFTFCS